MSTEQTNNEQEQSTAVEMTQPIVVDLGRQKSGKLKRLKRGEGELWEELYDVLAEVKDMLGEDAEGKTLVPIVMIYEKKRKRKRIEKLLFPLA